MISRPISANNIYTTTITKVIYYSRVFQCLSTLTFSQLSTSYSIHASELPTRGSSILL